MSQQNNIIYKVQVDTQSGKINIDGITKGFEQADKSFSKLKNNISKSANTMNKALDNTAKASGAASNATMELSRVISDAPYGIRGMANNLTQLVSQIGYASKGAGGLAGAFKGMWRSLMGPMGIVFAVTTAISALDFFAGSTKKAEDNTKGLNEELDELNTLMGKSTDSTKLATDNIREYLRLLEDKRELDKTIKGLDEEKIALDEKILWNKNRQIELEDKIKNSTLDTTKVEKELEAVKKRGLELENQLVDIYDRGQKALNNYKETKDGLTKAEEGTIKALELQKTALEKEQKQVSKTSAQYKDYAKQIDAIQKKIEAITGGKNGKGKRDKVVSIVDSKTFMKNAGKVIAETEKYQKKILGLQKTSNVTKLMLERSYERKRIMALKGDNSEALKAMEQFYNEAIALEQTKSLQASVDLDKKPVSTSAFTPEQIKEEAQRRLEATIATTLEASDVMVDLLTSGYEREIAIEQNKTNALNAELQNRLNNENLSASERKRIQLEISKNDEAMRVKKDKLEKKAFNLQKASNIANALVDTYRGAQSAFVNTMANPMNKILPDAGLLKAKVNAGIATAMGLANVAMIQKQRFQSTASGGGLAGQFAGGGSEGGNDRSFNFNLAGRSTNNQLANTLQGRFNQPLQAYVVSRDITNQQQLDEEIQSQTYFG